MTNSHCPACKKKFKNNELVVPVMKFSLPLGGVPEAVNIFGTQVAHQTCPTVSTRGMKKTPGVR